jgi:membrane associated rhomboid family serine protease
VHFSLQHLLVDAGALLLIGAVAEREMGGRWVAIALLAGAPLISVGLLLSAPDMSYFRGASALPILLGVAVGVSFWNSKPHLRMFLILCGAFLLIKVLFEATGFPLNAAALPTEIHVAWQAHLLAIISGCCTYCLRGKY